MVQLWWLSFCDPDKPKGTKFLGGIIAPGNEFVDAHLWTVFNHINPGGECAGHKIPCRLRVGRKMIGRLLSKQESQTFCDWVDAEVGKSSDAILARQGAGRR